MTTAKVVDVIARLPGCAGQAADAVSACTLVKNGRCTDVIENSNVRMSRHLDSSTTTQMAKVMVQHGRPSRSYWAKSVRSSSGRTMMGKAIRESSIGTRLGKSSNLGMITCKPQKGLFLSVYGRYQTGWKDTKHQSDLENSHERRWFGRTNILPRPFLFGLHSKRMQNEQRYCGQLPNYVLIQDLCRSKRKATFFRETWRRHLCMVLWHGRSCKEMCGTLLWVGKQDDSTTLQSIYTMPWWPLLQRRRNEICWAVVTSMLSNCSEVLVLGTYWKAWYSMVSEQTCTSFHYMDQSSWHTIMPFDLLHSSYMWIQTELPCGKHCQTMQDWDCFKTPILREILRTQNPLLEEHCAFLEVTRLCQ